MGKFIDLTDKEFGRLVVIERIGISKSGGNALWLCQCSCGQSVTVQAPDLKSGHTQSCGCLQKEVIARLSIIHGHNLNKKVSPTYKINNRNRRDNRLITYKGETRCLSEWAEKYNINSNTLWMRLYQYNWSLEKALTTPVSSIKRKLDG